MSKFFILPHMLHTLLSPKLNETEPIESYVEQHVSEILALNSKVVAIYDLASEKNRFTGQVTTYVTRLSSLQYLCTLRHKFIERQLPEPEWLCFYSLKSTDTLVSIQTWFQEHAHWFDYLVIAGTKDNSLKVETIYPHLPKEQYRVRLGAVTIPTRPHEIDRCLHRIEKNTDFFISQILVHDYDSEEHYLEQWKILHRTIGDRTFWLSTAVTSARQQHILRSLGVDAMYDETHFEKPLVEKIGVSTKLLEKLQDRALDVGYEIFPEKFSIRNKHIQLLRNVIETKN